MCLVGGFALPWIAYEWKVVIWDDILCPWLYGAPGFTPIIVADWSGVILAGIFDTGSVMAVGQMFFNRRER